MPREACVGNWMLRYEALPLPVSRPGRAPFDKYALGISGIWNRMCKKKGRATWLGKPRPKGSKHPKALGLTCTYTHMSIYLAYIYIYIYIFLYNPHIYIYYTYHVYMCISLFWPGLRLSIDHCFRFQTMSPFFSRHIYIYRDISLLDGRARVTLSLSIYISFMIYSFVRCSA